MVSWGHLDPGDKAEIRARVSTKGRRGRVVKTVFVFSNDPQRSPVALSLVLNVVDPYHDRRHDAGEIFKQPCAPCHIERGEGKTGASLFNSVCLLCHRLEKRDSNLSSFRSMPDEALRTAIYSGVPGTLMPGFSWKEGGALSDDEIDSILRYIKSR